MDDLLDQCYLIEQDIEVEMEKREEFNGPVPDLIVCAECGSSDVEELMWVKINTNIIVETADSMERWCCNCMNKVDVTTQSEYNERKEEQLTDEERIEQLRPDPMDLAKEKRIRERDETS